ncbi:MAG: hypothetical protein E3J71_08755 [Candidatus Stahlbacteria bacterium]|nr:MAG: hypothetical protein E3J71_08755 [Candidatus Stahlbacteria bacterium]
MKRIFTLPIFQSSNLLILTLLIPAALSAAPVLVEAYQEGTITLPSDKIDTVTVVELSFSVDTSCYVQFTAGEIFQLARLWLNLNGDDLHPCTREGGLGQTHSGLISYSYLLSSGNHSVTLKMAPLLIGYGANCQKAYLQALIFLPDTATAIAEQPTSDAEPRGNTPSLISSGPYVNIAGATELVDASGRVIENAIEDDKVYLSNLPTGTYFARNADRTVVKIVKVE